MSQESIFADNVILEVSDTIGTEDLTQQIQTGTNTSTTTTSTACQPKANAVDQAYNSPWKHNYGKYAGNHHNYWFTAGPLSQGTGMQQVMDVGGQWWYTPINKLLYIDLGVNSLNTLGSGGSPTADSPEFDRVPPVAWPNSTSPLKPYNAQDWDYNVHGRTIYFLERGTSSPKGYPFDVVDSYGPYTLVLLANGEDDATAMNNAIPNLNDDYGSQELDWYVSAYQHAINWNTSGNEFTWTNDAETVIQSYNGNVNFSTTGGYPYQVNECFDNKGYLGLRSSYFHYDYTDYEITIDVGQISNAEIIVFNDGGSNYTINSTGVHKFCVDLKMCEHWGGTSNISSGGVGIDGSPGGIQSQFFDVFEGGVTLLEAQEINPSSPASISINNIKILKKETVVNTTTTTTPVYTTTVFGTKDIEDWQYLDVLESEAVPFSLNFSVGDLRDMSKRSTGFSKTFNIPASQHNNRVLSPMLGVGNERNAVDIEKGNPYISWHKARVKVNGIFVFQGLMRVEEGNTGAGGFYKCHLIEEHIDWTLAIGKKNICDIDLFDGKTHLEDKSRANITASWNNSPSNGDVFFWGLVNYGEWYAQAINTGSSHDYDHNANDFHPVVFAKALVERIFADVGYTIESNFFDSKTFEQLCHPYSSGESYFDGDGGDVFGEYANNACHVELPGYHTTYNKGSFCSHGIHYPCWTCSSTWAYWYPSALVPGSDPGNNWSTNSSSGGYTVPFTGMYYIGWVAKLYNKQGGTEMSCLGIRIKKNGSTISSVSSSITTGGSSMSCSHCCASWASGASNGITKDMDAQVFLNAGDNISLQVFGANKLWLFHAYTKVENVKLNIYPVASSTVPALPVSINSDKILPCTKQIDYIKGLTEMFNLQWTSDNEKKIVYCEPYDDFFGSGKTLDWSEKLDYTSWNDKYIVEELAKKITFKYKRDTSDEMSEMIYRWRESQNQDIYKSHVEENDQKFRKEELEMGTKVFSSTVQFNAYGKQPTPNQNSDGHYNWGDLTWTNPNSSKENPLMPAMWSEVGGYINRQDRPPYNDKPKFDLRILNYYGKTDCSSWKFIDANANSHTHTNYPHLGWKNNWLKNISEDPYSLHWSDDSDGYGNTSPGLFSKYWRNAYLKMNGGSALRTCMMNLTPVDIATFDYRDLIHIKIEGVSTYWTVNKIIDYKPNQTVLTKVELVEWKQAVDFAKDRERQGRLADPTVALDRENKMLSRGSRLSYLQSKEQNSTDDPQQTVLGRYSQSNSTDVLQVGAGKNDRDRTTALSISQEGEVQIHGGEIAVEEADGLVHDLVYTEEVVRDDGTIETNIKKLYLKKEQDLDSNNNSKNTGTSSSRNGMTGY